MSKARGFPEGLREFVHNAAQIEAECFCATSEAALRCIGAPGATRDALVDVARVACIAAFEVGAMWMYAGISTGEFPKPGDIQ